MHKIGANLYCKLPVALFCAKSIGLGGWVGGWMDGWAPKPFKGLLTAIKNGSKSIGFYSNGTNLIAKWI